jgi:hypothetical protein
MRKHLTKKRVVLLTVAALVIGISTGAFAYFTSSGSGSGSATVGSSAAIQLSNVTVGDLYPGGADVPVTVDITNPGSGVEHIADISGSLAVNGGCLGSWFEVDTINYNDDLAPGASNSASTNMRILNSGTDQDACQGLTMTINWSSN